MFLENTLFEAESQISGIVCLHYQSVVLKTNFLDFSSHDNLNIFVKQK